MRIRQLLLIVLFLTGFTLIGCDTDTPIDDEDPPITDPNDDDENPDDEDPDEGDSEIIDLSGYDDLTGRTITFFDDFNGDTLDESVWEHMLGTGAAYGLGYWGNGEAQYYKAENTTIVDGELHITAKLEDTVAENGTTIMHYTSSRIRTKGSFAQAYGRFEIRARLDTAAQGLWPAFWLLSEDNVYGGWPYSGEIDIMEIRGRLPFVTTSALHFYQNRHKYYSGEVNYPNGSSATDFHVYAVEWTPERMTWYVDDVVILDLTEWESNVGEFPAPFDQEFHMLINFAVGGGFDGGRLPPDEALPATLIVDYVRVLAYEDGDGSGRKIPEGEGSVYLTLDQLTIAVDDGPVNLEFFVFDGLRGDVAWFSSDESVAVVNQAGRVTPLAPGTTVIRVATAASEAFCTITVTSGTS